MERVQKKDTSHIKTSINKMNKKLIILKVAIQFSLNITKNALLYCDLMKKNTYVIHKFAVLKFW